MPRLAAASRLVLSGGLALMLDGPARPAASAIVEYHIPTAGAFPHDPAVDQQGRVWYTDQANSRIGRLDPATGQIPVYRLPATMPDPHTPLLLGAYLWFTVQRWRIWLAESGVERLGRIDVAVAR